MIDKTNGLLVHHLRHLNPLPCLFVVVIHCPSSVTATATIISSLPLSHALFDCCVYFFSIIVIMVHRCCCCRCRCHCQWLSWSSIVHRRHHCPPHSPVHCLDCCVLIFFLSLLSSLSSSLSVIDCPPPSASAIGY